MAGHSIIIFGVSESSTSSALFTLTAAGFLSCTVPLQKKSFVHTSGVVDPGGQYAFVLLASSHGLHGCWPSLSLNVPRGHGLWGRVGRR